MDQNDKYQIAANIALLLGLVLVAMQINQANNISAAEFLDADIRADAARQLALLGNDPNQSMYRVLYKHEEATEEDFFVADRVYETLTGQMNRSIVMEEEGLYLGSVRGYISSNYEMFASPYGVAYLDQEIAALAARNGGENRAPTREQAYQRALERMRDLASSNPASKQMDDRVKRANAATSPKR